MSFVVMNVLTVPAEMRDVLEQRFAKRAGEVETMDGFEHFELLRPAEGQDNYLVYTRWQSEAHFKAWMESPKFGSGHAQSSTQGPASTGSQIWTFEVAESKTVRAAE